MSRYTGPTTRINRRFGQTIFPATKAYERKPYPPGIHGPRLRRRASAYSVGLTEKQKLRFTFGLTEKQFRRTFETAKHQRGITGEVFLRLLETRLDSIVYACGFGKTRQAARQFVNHGHIKVNTRRVDIASYSCAPGDEIEIWDRTSSRQLATRSLEDTQYRSSPTWISVDVDGLRATIDRLPQRQEMEQSVNEQLIVEFYSR